MNAPVGATLAQRTERILGIGEPRLGSRFWLVYPAFLVVLSLGWILWPVFSGDAVSRDAVFLQWGVLFLGLCAVADAGGALLYVRYGAASGRTLRALGHAVFFPLALCLYLAQYWLFATWLFVVEALVVGAFFVSVAVRVVRRVRDGHRGGG